MIQALPNTPHLDTPWIDAVIVYWCLLRRTKPYAFMPRIARVSKACEKDWLALTPIWGSESTAEPCCYISVSSKFASKRDPHFWSLKQGRDASRNQVLAHDIDRFFSLAARTRKVLRETVSKTCRWICSPKLQCLPLKKNTSDAKILRKKRTAILRAEEIRRSRAFPNRQRVFYGGPPS